MQGCRFRKQSKTCALTLLLVALATEHTSHGCLSEECAAMPYSAICKTDCPDDCWPEKYCDMFGCTCSAKAGVSVDTDQELQDYANAGNPQGDKSCECINATHPSYQKAVADNALQGYPENYGLACVQHDLGRDLPTKNCTKANPPSFCNAKWCFVDKDTCAMAIAQEESTTIPGLVYSYATCGSTNTYTVHTVVDTFTFSGDFSSACGSYKEIDYTVDSVEIKDKDTAPTLPPSSAPAPAPAPPSSTSLCENPWIWIAIVAIISINLITTLVLICFLRCWIAIPMASRHEDGKSGEGHHDTHVEVKVVNDQEHQDVEKLHQEFQDLAKEEHVIEEQVTSMQNKMDSFFKELKSGSFRAPKQHSSLTAEAYLESSADAKKQIMQRVDDDYEKLHGEMSEIAREEHALTEQMASMQSRLDSFFEEMRSMNNVHEAGSNSGKNGFERQPSSNDSQSAAPRPRSMNSRPVSMNSQQSSMMAQKTSAQGWQDNNFEVQGEELEETGHQRGMKNFDTSSVDDSQRSAVISTSPKIPTLHLKHLIAGDEGPGYQESGTENMKQKKTSGIRRHSSMVIGNDRQDRNLVSDESAVTKQTKMNRAASMSGRGSERDAHFASDALTPRRVGNGGGLKGLSFSQQRSQGGSGLDWDHAVKRMGQSGVIHTNGHGQAHHVHEYLHREDREIWESSHYHRQHSQFGQSTPRDQLTPRNRSADLLTPRKRPGSGGMKALSFVGPRGRAGSGVDWNKAIKRMGDSGIIHPTGHPQQNLQDLEAGSDSESETSQDNSRSVNAWRGWMSTPKMTAKWAARQEGKMALSRNNPGNSTSNKQVFVNQRAAPTWDGFMSRTFKGSVRNIGKKEYSA